MATYEEIYGKRVKDFDSDPTLDSSYEGQVWYNSATGTLKSVVSFASWSSSSDALYPAYNTSGFGVQTASVFIAGSYPNYNSNTQEYNGSGFSVGGTYPESRSGIGTAGILTAGLAWGGNSSPEFESQLTNEYNGTSWTNVNNYPITVAFPAGAGTQTAGLGSGGWDYSGPFSAKNTTNEYDGTNWTGGGNLNTARSSLFGGGTQTASIMAGGDKFTPGTASDNSGACEEYNGTSWTSVNSLPGTTNGAGGRTTNAVQTDFRILSGASGTAFTSPYVKNYEYDGTNWAAGPNYTTARYGAAGSGTGPAAIITGGRTPSYVLTTEEFNKSINTITAAAFSSMGAMGTSRYGHSAAGDKDAAVVVSGRPTGPSPTTNVEEYNGSSWSEVTNVPSGKFYAGGGMGTQTASIFAGGFGSPPEGVQTSVESYDGTNWSDLPSLNTGKFSACPAGTQTAGLLAGGSPANNTSEEWDGSSWTEGNNLTESFDDVTGAGIQTAAIAMGGSSPGTFAETDTELYDGTNWTNGPTMSTGRRRASAAGTQTDALVLAGLIPGPAATTAVEGFDGTSFFTNPSLGTSRYYGYGFSATSGNAYISGGLTSPGAPNDTTAAEEFTASTETATASTLTTS